MLASPRFLSSRNVTSSSLMQVGCEQLLLMRTMCDRVEMVEREGLRHA